MRVVDVFCVGTTPFRLSTHCTGRRLSQKPRVTCKRKAIDDTRNTFQLLLPLAGGRCMGAGRHCPELNLTSAITTSDDGGPEYLAMTPISPSYAEPSRDRPSVKPARTLATPEGRGPSCEPRGSSAVAAGRRSRSGSRLVRIARGCQTPSTRLLMVDCRQRGDHLPAGDGVPESIPSPRMGGVMPPATSLSERESATEGLASAALKLRPTIRASIHRRLLKRQSISTATASGLPGLRRYCRRPRPSLRLRLPRRWPKSFRGT